MRTAHIGMGSNLASSAGPPDATLAAASVRLTSLGRVSKRSSIYSTEPVGFSDQPRFVNAVVELETELSPMELLDGLLEIEREFGRDRTASVPNGPRTLDLDILLYDDLILAEPNLDIPHPRLAERAFVLVPLCEIAAEFRHPVLQKTMAELLRDLDLGRDSESDAVLRIESEVWRGGGG